MSEDKNGRSKQLSARIPSGLMAQLKAYAEKHELSVSAATVALLRRGLEVEQSKPATAQDLADFREALRRDVFAVTATVQKAIAEQPIQVAGLLETSEEQAEKAARDERERIRALPFLKRLRGDF